MKVVSIMWGLANQTFQYLFLKRLQQSAEEPLYIDDSYFYLQNMEKYATGRSNHISPLIYHLNKLFEVDVPTLADYYGKDAWAEMCAKNSIDYNQNVLQHIDPWQGRYPSTVIPNTFTPAYLFQECIPIQMRRRGMDLKLVTDIKSHMVNYGENTIYTEGAYRPDIFEISGNVFYYGIWPHENWSLGYVERIGGQLITRAFCDEDSQNKKYNAMIRNTESVALHYRDFYTTCSYFQSNQDVADYYESVLAQFRKELKHPVFYVFSDFTPKIKESPEKYGLKPSDEIVFVEGNEDGENNYKDLLLMSRCKHAILSGSTFSWLAFLLNQNKNIYYANPAKGIGRSLPCRYEKLG